MNFWQKFKNLGRNSTKVEQSRSISANTLRLYQQEICDLESQCELAGSGVVQLQQSLNIKMAEAEAIIILLNRRKGLADVLKLEKGQATTVLKLNREVIDLSENHCDLIAQIKQLRQRQTRLQLTLDKALQLAQRHRGDLKKLQDTAQDEAAQYSISVLELLEQVNQSCNQLALLIPAEAINFSGNSSSSRRILAKLKPPIQAKVIQ